MKLKYYILFFLILLVSCNQDQKNIITLNKNWNDASRRYNDEWLFGPNKKFRFDDLKKGYKYKSIIDTSKFTNQVFAKIFDSIINKYPLLDFYNGYVMGDQFEKNPGYIFEFYLDSTNVFGLIVFLPDETIKLAENQKIKPDLNFLKSQRDYRTYQILRNVSFYKHDQELSNKIDSIKFFLKR